MQLTTSSATAEDVQIDLKDEGDKGGSRALVAKGGVKDAAQPIADGKIGFSPIRPIVLLIVNFSTLKTMIPMKMMTSL